MKRDPFSSLREALAAGVAFECRHVWYGNPYYDHNSVPHYHWSLNGEQYRYGAHLRDQLALADTKGYVEWETIEQHNVLECMDAAKQEGAGTIYRLKKKLVAFNPPEPKPVILKAERPALGERRIVVARAVRCREWKKDPHGIERKIVWWQRIPYVPMEGVFIGYRTLYEGVVEVSQGEDGSAVFLPLSTMEAWKFVSNPRQEPFFVFPEDAHV